MQKHHKAWLLAHPHRTADWLAERLRDGFDVHHLDGNHDNNDPLNLVLIDGADHMMLHNGRSRLVRISQVGKPKQRRRHKVALARYEETWRQNWAPETNNLTGY